MKVGIIDYGSGNFASVWNAFGSHTSDLLEITSARQLSDCSHLVLPGVGAFSAAVERLHEMELFYPLKALLEAQERPFLGICVGMQVLADAGTEHVETPGLGITAGRVEKFDYRNLNAAPRLPHMGWNEVDFPENSVLFRGIDPLEKSFYFVHSYHLSSPAESAQLTYSEHGYRFIAAIEQGSTFGVQFHPEKSQNNGRRLIANFLGFSG